MGNLFHSDSSSSESDESDPERQLVSNESNDYRFALEESCILAITDQKGTIRYANDNFCEISKYTREELIGQDHRIINSGYHSKEYIRNLWVTIANGKIWRGELKNKAKDGTHYWVDTTIVPFLNRQGKPYQYIAIRADITMRKKAEEEILKLKQELELRVDQRTEELEAFSYSVSHDLRAPLRAINGFSQILQEDYAELMDEEGKRILNIIKDNARNMGNLIDNLLSFSRLGRKEITRTWTDMNSLVNEVWNDLDKKENRSVEFNKLKLHPVVADKVLLRQVLLNLLSNALKYSSQKEKSIITVDSESDSSGVTYTITDNGAGFESEYKHKLFGVFQRLHAQEDFEGTGVGLALVKRIIDKHQGRVWADGSPGKGAKFSFFIPQF